MSVFEGLEAVFRQTFNQPTLTLREDLTARDVRGWDSLKHMELIVAVETRFQVRFKTVEVTRLKSVGDLAALVSAKLAAKQG